MADRDRDWYRRAACRDENPDWWVIQPGTSYGPTEANRHAVRICRTCEVWEDCIREAIRVGDDGVIRAGVMLHTPNEVARCIGCHRPFLRPKRRKNKRRHCARPVCSALHAAAPELEAVA